MADVRLELVDVVAGYGPCPVLTGVSLAVRGGEMVGILGANGCGKTTLLRVASGAVRPTSGSVVLEGRDLSAETPRDVARRIAVLPQESAPAFPVGVLETVLLGRLPWRTGPWFDGDDDVRAAEEALAAADALALRDRELGALSGGERQRVLLARALCQGGAVLLCDEPTAHLDLRHQASVFRCLRRLADGGRAVVVVTHDLELAAQACDRVVLLARGCVVAAGAPRDVLDGTAVSEAFGVEARVHVDAAGIPHVVRSLGTEPKGEGRT